MIAQEIYVHILPVVRAIMEELNGSPDAATIEERIHARIWPYVTHAVREIDPSAIGTETPKRDGRAKPWKYVVRFWNSTPIGNDLLAESDEEIMQSTGSLPAVLAQYGRDMHTPEENAEPDLDYLPAELSETAIKEKLPQLRNNLGRSGSGVLRIPYTIGDESYICQVDIAALVK